ncbi:probable ATP-dependent RNA helicase kurz [Varroa destructor]|uniref:RNA helicase n=1 Tax=Varroa destructor TaxID=109461 RepID=A0A7M7JK93_VARDE|nr:probable ATP-dependent RNA helicase kurz [Varroa destructor]XP_022653237.1 probable ATP-dependent RNA helicase kurz [Varroa destructor]XP_022653238.1 probable ATP-dependent RNA helicase kurz [Varroa destructor]
MGRIKKLKKLLRYKEVQESLLRDKGHAPGETDPNAEILPEAQDGTAKPLKKNILRKGAAIQKPALNLSKKKRKQLLKILEKKQKKVNRDDLVAQLSKIKEQTTKSRKRLAKDVDLKSLRKRKAPSVQAWGKQLTEDKKRTQRSDVLSFDEDDEDDSDNNEADSQGEDSDHDENDGAISQKDNTSTCGEHTQDGTVSSQNVSNIIEKATRLTVKNKLEKVLRQTELQKTEDEEDDIPDVNATIGHLKPRRGKQSVVLNRPAEVIEHRSKLPIISMEQEIMETIETNPVTVICGQTGSGKTTQLVQFLYEVGYAREGMIGITEPRRVATISMSKRVAYETGLGEKVVSYQVRFEGNCTEETRVKFLTDGVLLKEMESDLSLSNYSVIIIDEAHERSVHSDVAVGLLSRVVRLREKKGKLLRVIVMSATLRVSDFIENERLFKQPPPVINVQARQFPVTIHFNRTTPKDYMADAFKKICKIHKNLPPGGILVFLTGRMEVNQMVAKLRRKFGEENKNLMDMKEPFKEKEEKNKADATKNGDSSNGSLKSNEEPKDDGDKPITRISVGKEDNMLVSDLASAHNTSSTTDEGQDATVTTIDVARTSATYDCSGLNLESYSVVPLEDGELDEKTERDMSADYADDEDADQEILEDASDENEELLVKDCPEDQTKPMKVLPMFAMLPSHLQQKVFDRVPEGTRLCVVATNVAETSLTIPGVRYVIDAGKCKTRVYDRVTGISKFIISWISKASAEQRAGRAGRQGPGHCYRLYSAAVFNDQFIEFSPAEVTLRPVEGLLLQMKCMGIEKVVNFPFPSPPPREALIAAENSLVEMRALTRGKVKPLSLREREAWLYSSIPTPLGRAMSLFPVAPRFAKMLALSHQQKVLMPYVVALVAGLAVQEPFIQGNATCPTWCRSLGDMGRLLAAVGASEYDTVSGSSKAPLAQQLREEARREIRKMRYQLTEELNLLVPDLQLTLDPRMPPPDGRQMLALRQLILCACVDRIARKKSGKVYESMQTDGQVYLHGESVSYKEQPPWLVYQEITEEHGNRMQLRMVCPIEPSWLPVLAPQQCVLSEPLESPAPEYHERDDIVYVWVEGTYGPFAWKIDKTRMKAPAHWPARFNWFAKALLDGKVITQLRKYKPSYTSQPAIVVKKYAAISQRASDLVEALRKANVCSRADLLARWKVDPKFLLRPYLDWCQTNVHGQIKMSWPPRN